MALAIMMITGLTAACSTPEGMEGGPTTDTGQVPIDASVAEAGVGGAGFDDPSENDPYEDVNRAIFSFNEAVDDYLLRPVTWVYRETLPDPVRKGVTNFLRYLRTPVILLSDLLQGDLDRAGETLERFAINTPTLGLVDWAALQSDIPFHSEDFGQTLAVWGVDEGPYLVLPILGPSNVRDGVGLVVDWAVDPAFWYTRNNDMDELSYGRFILTAIDFRDRHMEEIDDLKRTSVDYYAKVRSIYRQNRAAEIANGALEDTGPSDSDMALEFMEFLDEDEDLDESSDGL